jgi:SAM-dependent methyltransferase
MPEWHSAQAYENFMGRWSRRLAEKFLGWLAVPPGQVWLDLGCGTGAMTGLILQGYQPAKIYAVDASPVFIEHARQSIRDPRAHFSVGLAQSLTLPAHSVDVTASGLMLNFVPEPRAAVLEMLKVTRPGGTIGIFVWDYAGGMQMLRYFFDAAIALNPAAHEVDEGERFWVCRPGNLEQLVTEAGLRQVEGAALEINTRFASFYDYWQPFLGGVGPASIYALSLNPTDRRALKERLRHNLPTAADGTIALTATAWAVKGTV